MDVKVLECHRLSQETRAHDEEQSVALENHNTIHVLKQVNLLINENFWIKLPTNKHSDNYQSI